MASNNTYPSPSTYNVIKVAHGYAVHGSDTTMLNQSAPAGSIIILFYQKPKQEHNLNK